ncbi:MAG TPA: SDR family oxidoreductase [Thermoanaerobaculia bacterium]|nr:SDR family oxidoreductase [Thermoanaerobaculia bacterium]
MRILVTGHKGYIGSALVPALVAAGHEVEGLDVDFFASAGAADLVNVPEIRKDIRDVGVADLEGFSAVIHLAALSNDPIGDLDPELTYEINYHSSVRLASLAKAAGVERFIFSSSCSNYGAATGRMMTEDSTLNPVTVYGRSKVLTEGAVQSLASESFSPVFLRNATAYGVSRRMRTDLVVNNMVAWVFTTGRIRILSDGTPWRPLVHVRDIAAAFVAVIRAPRQVIHNQVLNIGRTEENYQVRQVADIVAGVLPAASIEYAGTAGPDSRDYRVSFDKVARLLPAFVPRWNVRLAVEELLDFYARVKLTVDDIQGPRFARIARIKQLLESGALDSELRWKAH